MPKKTYFLTLENTQLYSITVEAENQEEAANIGMAVPIEKWTNLRVNSSILKHVQEEPKGNTVLKFRIQKWGKHKDRWVRRKRRG